VGITVIERVKIQAQVLVPLVKALQAELGKERANCTRPQDSRRRLSSPRPAMVAVEAIGARGRQHGIGRRFVGQR